MFIRPILICAAGVITLQLLTARAEIGGPLEIPKGWYASDSIGKQYFIGYDSREKAYFIANTEPIKNAARDVNSGTEPDLGSQHVPYSATGLKETDPWAAALLQSVKALPYLSRKLRLEAEIKTPGFNGQSYLMLRGVFPDTNTNTTIMTTASGADWHSVVVEMDEVPDDGTLSFGVLLQGEGRVLIRDVKLTLAPMPEKEVPSGTHLQDMFGDPPAAETPVNLELRR